MVEDNPPKQMNATSMSLHLLVRLQTIEISTRKKAFSYYFFII